ncbi:type II toxin-antitoxin system Phd/YefM family antitoxin [Candidatus Kaiserbacteria bacterium]|nr:type II toxin-antitoxin system Phd/YefM family antitoxin [Candidatus Kaiserbacteria bacterium]
MAKITVSDSNIGLKELRDNVDTYIAAVKKGKKFTVYRHSKPVFAIVPPEEVEYDLDELDGPGWKTLIDFTKIRKGGVPAEEVLAAIDRVYGQS